MAGYRSVIRDDTAHAVNPSRAEHGASDGRPDGFGDVNT